MVSAGVAVAWNAYVLIGSASTHTTSDLLLQVRVGLNAVGVPVLHIVDALDVAYRGRMPV